MWIASCNLFGFSFSSSTSIFIKDSVDAVLVSQGVIADSVQRVLHRPSSLVKGLQRCTLRSGSHAQIYYTVLPSRSENPAYIQVRYRWKNDKCQSSFKVFIVRPSHLVIWPNVLKEGRFNCRPTCFYFLGTTVENREGLSSI